MGQLELTDIEYKLIEKYQVTKDNEIALYFFNKVGKELLNVIYSKVNNKFSDIPFEKEDLTSLVWKGIKEGLEVYKRGSVSLWSVWMNKIYFCCIKEIKKYFKNSELILNYADSWDEYSSSHLIYHTAKAVIDEKPKESFIDILTPIVEYVVKNNRTYTKTDIKRILLWKSLGYSEREMAEKMHVSRRYVSSMIKLILRISKDYFKR